MVKVKFPDFIKSMSGTLSKRRLSDGRVESVIATKRGTIYKRTTYPKVSFPGRR